METVNNYDYNPDAWMIVKITSPEDELHYRVFGVWRGSYLSGDSWKLNSGITKVEQNDKVYYFHGESGSIYKCDKKYWGTSGYGDQILSSFKEQLEKEGGALEIVPESTDPITIKYQ